MAILMEISEAFGMVTARFNDGARLCMRKKDVKALALREGAEEDAQALEERLCALQAADGYEAALTLLDFRARTRKEILDKLARKGFHPRVCESAAHRLQEAGLLDDAELAQRMLQGPSAQRMGVYALKRKLRARGVSEEDAQGALSLMDDAQQGKAALEAAKKLYKRYEGLPAREARAKLSQALSRRGFSWDCVSSAIEALSLEEDDFT